MQSHFNVALVTLLAAAAYFWMATRVARTRQKAGIPAPAMTGDPVLERTIRAHLNTLEWLPIFLPSLWLFAVYWNSDVAAALGLAWIVGRIVYFVGYVAEPSKRFPGFFIQSCAAALLLVGAMEELHTSPGSQPLPHSQEPIPEPGRRSEGVIAGDRRLLAAPASHPDRLRSPVTSSGSSASLKEPLQLRIQIRRAGGRLRLPFYRKAIFRHRCHRREFMATITFNPLAAVDFTTLDTTRSTIDLARRPPATTSTRRLPPTSISRAQALVSRRLEQP